MKKLVLVYVLLCVPGCAKDGVFLPGGGQIDFDKLDSIDTMPAIEPELLEKINQAQQRKVWVL